MTSPVDPATSVAEHIASLVQLPGYASLEVHVSVAGDAFERTREPSDSPSGPPEAPGAMAELYCAAKPLVATGALALAAQAGVDVTAPIVELVGHVDGLEPTDTIAALLCHRTSLLGPSGMEWMCTPLELRGDTVLARADRHCYSEVAGGLLVDLAWTATTGRRLDDDLAERVFGPFGDGEVVIDGRTAASLESAQFRIELAPSARGPVPLLHVCAQEYRRRTSVAFSGWASCRGYHDALTAVVEERGPFEGVGGDILAASGRWGSAGSGPRLDALLDKVVGFRSGFMVVEESAGVAPSRLPDLLVTNAGLAQKVSVVSPSASLVVTAWTNLNIVADIESLVFRDAVVTAADLVMSEVSA